MEFKNLEDEVKMKADFVVVAKNQMAIEQHEEKIREQGVNFQKHVHENENRIDKIELSFLSKLNELNNSLKHIPTNARIEADNLRFTKMVENLSQVSIKKREFEQEQEKNHRNNLARINELKNITQMQTETNKNINALEGKLQNKLDVDKIEHFETILSTLPTKVDIAKFNTLVQGNVNDFKEQRVLMNKDLS